MSNQAFTPLQTSQFSLEDFQTPEGINRLNQFFSNITKTVNANIGTGGPVTIPSGIDVKGSSITNVGGIGPEHTAVSHDFAEKNYSASALRPKLEGGGSHSLRSVRRVNDSGQQEMYSGFLDSTMNTAPTTNTAAVSGAGDTVTVSAGNHTYVSGRVLSFASRTDTLSVPAGVAITSLSRASSIVTAILVSAIGLTPGEVVNVSGASDPSFDGSFVILTVVGTTVTWRQVAVDATATGGTASSSGCYYYFLRRYSQLLSLAGPFDSDSQQNRLSINTDGSVLIAVAIVNGSGVDLTQSAAGATPPPATGGNHILTRL